MQSHIFHGRAPKKRYKSKLLTYVYIFFLLCAVLMLLSIFIAYLLDFWQIELDYGTNSYSSQYSNLFPRIIIKSRLPSFSLSANDVIDLMPSAKEMDYSKVAKPDLTQIVKGNITAIKEAMVYQKIHHISSIPERRYISLASNCDTFIKNNRYIMKSISFEEESFPIAFSILIFEDLEQFERLLRAIYRPQNYYCVHVDKKSPKIFQEGARVITECFDNVFLTSKSFDVRWGTYSVLEPEFICMEELWKFKSWKYFINLTGKEYPLKTNLDLVKILTVFNGANNMEASEIRRNRDRTLYVYNGTNITDTVKSPPPIPVTLTKGSVHITASRAFIDYVLHDPRALAFRNWVKDTGFPDETFFSSLNHSPQLNVPGAYAGLPETDPETYPFLTRFKNWGDGPFNFPCYGLRIRRICVFGVGDIPLLSQRPELFANKFYKSYQPLAFQYMEELHNLRTQGDIDGSCVFNASLYARYDFTWNHL